MEIYNKFEEYGKNKIHFNSEHLKNLRIDLMANGFNGSMLKIMKTHGFLLLYYNIDVNLFI